MHYTNIIYHVLILTNFSLDLYQMHLGLTEQSVIGGGYADGHRETRVLSFLHLLF